MEGTVHGMFTSFTQKACLRTNTGRLPKGNAQQRTTTMKSKMSDQRMIDYTDMLDGLTWEIETAITNYELEVVEDLHDEENDIIIRAMKWSRGDKHHTIIITPFGQLRHVSKNTPINLLHQIVNTAVATMWDIVGVEYEDGSKYTPPLLKNKS